MDENLEIAKDWLKMYRPLKARFKMYNRRIKRAEQNLNAESGLVGVSFEGIAVSPTYKISNIVERQVIKSLDEYETMVIKRDTLAGVLEDMEIALEGLKMNVRRIIKLKYLSDEEMSWEQVADIVKGGEMHVRHRLHKKGLQGIIDVMGKHNIEEYK